MMREILKACATLCVHAENPLLGSLPEGWLLDPVVFSLDLDGPYTTRVFLYINFAMKQAVFVCQTDEVSHSKQDDLVEYQRRFIEYFKKKKERTTAGQIKDFSGWEQIQHTFLAKIAGLSWMYTGFGSGGCLAQVYAYHDAVPAISIDSPGNKTLLGKIFETDASVGNLKVRAIALLHIFLMAPNSVNILDEQIGDVYRIKMPCVNETSWQHMLFSLLDFSPFILYPLVIKRAYVVISLLCSGIKLYWNSLWDFKPVMDHIDLATVISKNNSSLHEHVLQKVNTSKLFVRESGLLARAALKDIWYLRIKYSSVYFLKLLGMTAALKLLGFFLIKTPALYSQHNIFSIYSCLIHQSHLDCQSMVSWPRVFKVKKLNGWQFVKNSLSEWRLVFIPFNYHLLINCFVYGMYSGRLNYFFDENAYLEDSQIQVLPGYVEDTRPEISWADMAPRILRNESAEQEEKSVSVSDASIISTYDASGHELTSRALGRMLGHIELNHSQFSALTTLNVSNNALDDDAARLLSLSTWMERLSSIDLSKNRLTITGFVILMEAFRRHESTVTALNVADNRIFFDNDNTENFPIDHRVDVSGNIVHFQPEVASDLLPIEQAVRQARNQALSVSVHNRFSLFANEAGFNSIFPWVKDKKITAQQSLVCVFANSALIHQHAFLLIERVNVHFLKEIVIYELFFDEKTNRAFVSCKYPVLSDERLSHLLEDDEYQSRCHSIPSEKDERLMARLNADVRRGRDFNYHSFASRGSDGVERVNCASWLAGHLRAVELPADLGWLNLPSDLVDQRSWLRRMTGF